VRLTKRAAKRSRGRGSRSIYASGSLGALRIHVPALMVEVKDSIETVHRLAVPDSHGDVLFGYCKWHVIASSSKIWPERQN
jgi:hypothetical protein